MVEIEIDSSEFDSLPEDLTNFSEILPEKTDLAMRLGAERVREILEEITPKRTGFTASAWTVIAVDVGEFVILNANEPIATFLSEGTAPHDIFPVSAQALHWMDETGEHFAAYVHHPGTEPLNLEETALAMAEPDVQQYLDEAEEEAWDEAML
jgi:hypothetical protein